MQLSSRGAAFIAQFEGVRLRLYNDPAGHATIGVGHLVHHGPINGHEPSSFRGGITRRQAMDLLRKDANRFAKAVDAQVRVPLKQHELDALISFAFNVGAGAFAGSTLLRRLNAGERSAVPGELMRWSKAGGRSLPGLVRRRQAEGRLFATGDYDPGPGVDIAKGAAAKSAAREAPEDEPSPLEPGEQAHLREWLGHREISKWAGYDDAMHARMAAADAWIDERCRDLRHAIEAGTAKENKDRRRRQRLVALTKRTGISLGPPVYPSAGCTAPEKAHIAEREVYVGLQSASDQQRARKLLNLDWLVDRRRRVWRLGKKDGWDEADRALRYKQLCIATHYGDAYETWAAARERAAKEAEAHEHAHAASADDHDGGLSPRGKALRWLSDHRGLTEQPAGSNCDGRADGIRKAELDCAGGATFLIGAPWCGVWCFNALQAAGVPKLSARLASVAFIEDDARAGRGPFRGWTNDRGRVLRGDLVVIGGRGVHVETVREVRGDGSVVTDGGNTSAGRAGSQSNGGGAFLRTRFPSEIHGFALVDYPDS